MRRHVSSSVAFLALAWLLSCAAKGTTDANAIVADAGSDANSSADAGTCVLGTADHCGACSTVCPGKTDDTTLAICSDATSAGTCTIECRGEYYDVDGIAANGCEAEGPAPHGIKEAAIVVTLPDSFDSDGGTTVNPLNVTGTILGDTRVHEITPASRPLGREAWYEVSVLGAGDPDTADTTACLSISTLPTDDAFEVCISDNGGDTFAAAGCATVMGGPVKSACVTPPNHGDAGVYYVKVRKVSGTNSANGYALYLKH